MDLRERQSIYRQAWLKWGSSAQILLAIEEMSELTQVLSKHLNGRLDHTHHQQILDEIADVQIMVEQLAYQIDPDGVENTVDRKVERLKGRLNVEQENMDTQNVSKDGVK